MQKLNYHDLQRTSEDMENDRRNLLYTICKLHLQKFNLNMKDTWDMLSDSNLSIELNHTLRNREKEYKEKYGELPQWKTIDEVQTIIKQLEGENK